MQVPRLTPRELGTHVTGVQGSATANVDGPNVVTVGCWTGDARLPVCEPLRQGALVDVPQLAAGVSIAVAISVPAAGNALGRPLVHSAAVLNEAGLDAAAAGMVQGTEEAMLNAMFASLTMVIHSLGSLQCIDIGRFCARLDHHRLLRTDLTTTNLH